MIILSFVESLALLAIFFNEAHVSRQLNLAIPPWMGATSTVQR